MKKYRYSDSDVYIFEQENYSIGLGQVEKLTPLSSIYYNNIRPAAAINCSYFYPEGSKYYVLGRNQGDTYNNTPDQAGYCLVLDNAGWHLGQFASWDYTNQVKAGFSVSNVLIKDFADINYSSPLMSDAATKLTNRMPQTAVAILSDNKAVAFVTDGRTSASKGLSGQQIRTFLKTLYNNIKYLVLCDGGGSSEMIVDGYIVNKPSDGKERPMLNALCFYGSNQPEVAPQKAILNFFDGTKDALSGISQKEGVGTHILNYANDFCGATPSDKYYLRAPYDCIVKAIATYDNTVFFESLGKIITPSGMYERCFFQATHMYDNDLLSLGIKVGKTFKQGDICYREGQKGIGSGNHFHFECGTGYFNGTTMPYKDSGKTYVYNGVTYELYVPCTSGEERHIYDMMYLNNIDTTSNIKSVYSWTYSTDSDLPVPVERDTLKDQVEVLVSNLRVRTSPDSSTKSNILGLCVPGFYNVKQFNNSWYQIDDYAYIADISGATLYYPAEKWVAPQPVDRDITINQIQNIGTALRIRNLPSLEGQIMGIAEIGYYNVLSETEADGYIWYQIGNGSYVAGVDGVVIYLPRTSDDINEELEKENERLTEENQRLLNENQNLTNELNSSLEQVQQLEELNAQQLTKLEDIGKLVEEIETIL